MSVEPEQKGETVTLKELLLNIISQNRDFLSRLVEEKDKLYTERLNAQKEAITKSEVANEKRFEAVNEFRAQLKDQQVTFLPRAEADARFSSTQGSINESKKMIEELRLTGSSNAGRGSGLNSGWVYLIGALGLISVLITIILNAGKLFAP